MKKLYLVVVSVIFSLAVKAQTEQTVIVEHFTNSVCPICASRNPAFYDLLDDHPNVLHVAYHPSAPYSSCIFYLFNPVENDARTNYYGVYGATPRIVIQGEVIPPSNPLMTPMQLEDRLGMMSDYSISFKHYYGNGDTVNARIMVKKLSGNTENGLTLYTVLAEKLIEYNAPNGENLHRDVFRKVVLNQDLNLQNAGDSIVKEIAYLPDPAWDENQMYLVGMVQKNDDKSILQAGSSGFVQNPAGISSGETKQPEDLFYPNPVSDYLNINTEYLKDYRKAEIFNLFGEKIKTTEDVKRINVSDLSGGYYFLVLTDKANTRLTTKFIKK